MSSHPFDDALRLESMREGREGSVWRGHTDPRYWHAIGPFGGTTAAIVLNSLLQEQTAEGAPISLSLTYASAIESGEFEVRNARVAASRSTQHWSAQIWQKGKVVVNAIALLAKRRESWSDCESVMPDVPPASSINPGSWSELGLEWLNRYRLRVVRGGFEAVSEGRISAPAITEQWIEDYPPRNLDFPALAACCDAFCSRLYLRKGEMLPAGTVSLTIFFHADHQALSENGSKPVLGVARAGRFYNRFFDQHAEVWREDGVLLATSQQMVWFQG